MDKVRQERVGIHEVGHEAVCEASMWGVGMISEISIGASRESG